MGCACGVVEDVATNPADQQQQERLGSSQSSAASPTSHDHHWPSALASSFSSSTFSSSPSSGANFFGSNDFNIFVPNVVHRCLSRSDDGTSLRFVPWSGFAAVVTVDLSGFSKLSSRLTAQNHPPHKLAEITNSLFSSILNITCNDAHGDFLIAAGDAIIAAWCIDGDDTGDESRKRIVAAAIRCAFELQKCGNQQVSVATMSAGGEMQEEMVDVRLHVGVACGRLSAEVLQPESASGSGNVVVGDGQNLLHSASCGGFGTLPRCFPFYTGPALKRSADACTAAPTTKVGVHYAALDLVSGTCSNDDGDGDEGHDDDDDVEAEPAPANISPAPTPASRERFTVFNADDLHKALPCPSAAATTIIDPSDERLMQSLFVPRIPEVDVLFVPPLLAQRVAVGLTLADTAEIREACVLFVKKASGASLGAFFTDVCQVVAKFRTGSITQILDDDKGIHVVCVFGQLFADAHVADVAVEACCALMEQLGVDGVEAIGVAHGSVFSGVVGTSLGSRWDCAGQCLVSACRLMEYVSSQNGREKKEKKQQISPHHPDSGSADTSVYGSAQASLQAEGFCCLLDPADDDYLSSGGVFDMQAALRRVAIDASVVQRLADPSKVKMLGKTFVKGIPDELVVFTPVSEELPPVGSLVDTSCFASASIRGNLMDSFISDVLCAPQHVTACFVSGSTWSGKKSFVGGAIARHRERFPETSFITLLHRAKRRGGGGGGGGASPLLETIGNYFYYYDDDAVLQSMAKQLRNALAAGKNAAAARAASVMLRRRMGLGLQIVLLIEDAQFLSTSDTDFLRNVCQSTRGVGVGSASTVDSILRAKECCGVFHLVALHTPIFGAQTLSQLQKSLNPAEGSSLPCFLLDKELDEADLVRFFYHFGDSPQTVQSEPAFDHIFRSVAASLRKLRSRLPGLLRVEMARFFGSDIAGTLPRLLSGELPIDASPVLVHRENMRAVQLTNVGALRVMERTWREMDPEVASCDFVLDSLPGELGAIVKTVALLTIEDHSLMAEYRVGREVCPVEVVLDICAEVLGLPPGNTAGLRRGLPVLEALHLIRFEGRRSNNSNSNSEEEQHIFMKLAPVHSHLVSSSAPTLRKCICRLAARKLRPRLLAANTRAGFVQLALLFGRAKMRSECADVLRGACRFCATLPTTDEKRFFSHAIWQLVAKGDIYQAVSIRELQKVQQQQQPSGNPLVAPTSSSSSPSEQHQQDDVVIPASQHPTLSSPTFSLPDCDMEVLKIILGSQIFSDPPLAIGPLSSVLYLIKTGSWSMMECSADSLGLSDIHPRFHVVLGATAEEHKSGAELLRAMVERFDQHVPKYEHIEKMQTNVSVEEEALVFETLARWHHEINAEAELQRQNPSVPLRTPEELRARLLSIAGYISSDGKRLFPPALCRARRIEKFAEENLLQIDGETMRRGVDTSVSKRGLRRAWLSARWIGLSDAHREELLSRLRAGTDEEALPYAEYAKKQQQQQQPHQQPVSPQSSSSSSVERQSTALDVLLEDSKRSDAQLVCKSILTLSQAGWRPSIRRISEMQYMSPPELRDAWLRGWISGAEFKGILYLMLILENVYE